MIENTRAAWYGGEPWVNPEQVKIPKERLKDRGAAWYGGEPAIASEEAEPSILKRPAVALCDVGNDARSVGTLTPRLSDEASTWSEDDREAGYAAEAQAAAETIHWDAFVWNDMEDVNQTSEDNDEDLGILADASGLIQHSLPGPNAYPL